jgi:hypothetical protein
MVYWMLHLSETSMPRQPHFEHLSLIIHLRHPQALTCNISTTSQPARHPVLTSMHFSQFDSPTFNHGHHLLPSFNPPFSTPATHAPAIHSCQTQTFRWANMPNPICTLQYTLPFLPVSVRFRALPIHCTLPYQPIL